MNRVTDKKNMAKGMMTQLPTTDIWHLTLHLPASYCGSYKMVETQQETPDETVLQLGSRFATLVGQADPQNKTPGINVQGNMQESILALDNPLAQGNSLAATFTLGSFSLPNIGSPSNLTVCDCIFLGFLPYNRWAYC